MFETMTSAFIDEFPSYLQNKKVLFTAAMCFVEFLLGIPCIMQVPFNLHHLQVALTMEAVGGGWRGRCSLRAMGQLLVVD